MKWALARRATFIALAMVWVLSAETTPSRAQISVSTQFNFSDTFGVNPIGNGTYIGGSTGFYMGGTYDSVGANAVTPSAGTTVTATQDGFTYNIPLIGTPGTPNPDEFYRDLPLDPSLTGAWTLSATNPSQPSGAIVQTPTLNILNPPGLATNVTLFGNGVAPTVSWSIPSNSSATTQTIYVFRAGVDEAIYKGLDLAAGTNTYTIPIVLTAGQSYSVAVQEDVRTNGTTGSIESRSRSFTAYFTAKSGTITTPIVLPSVSSTLSQFGGPIFDFDTPVIQGVPISIDPQSATGFIYKIGSGDPNFASVELPNVGNPGPYDLYLWNGSKFVLDQMLAADTTFTFASGGVSEFEVLGIDPSVGLNPNSATDFVTQLTFAGSGTFTGTMTPVLQVPEPSTWSMMLLGFAGLGFLGYRASRRSGALAA
jgi:hypothetical protein